MSEEERLPIPGGHFDYPTPETLLEPGFSRVSGWAITDLGTVDRLTLTVNGEAVGKARLGGERRDIAETFMVPRAALGGFQGMLDLRHLAPGPVQLSGLAEDALGRTFSLPEVELTLTRPDRPDPGHQNSLRPLPAAQPEVTTNPTGGKGLRLLIVTHDLAIGGAQIVLAELLRQIGVTLQAEGTVLAPRDGATREHLEQLGYTVRILGEYEARDPARYDRQLDEIVARERQDEFDLVLVNTACAYQGGDIAARLGLPAVWVIHESYGLDGLFAENLEGYIHPAVQARAAETLSRAAAAIFEVDATRRLYRYDLPEQAAITIPYGLDLDQLDRRLGAISRKQARQRIGAEPGEFVVLCLGTVEPRKGQTQLVEAFARATRKRRRARLLLVGARGDGHEAVPQLAAEVNGITDRVEIRPVTDDPISYLKGCDLLVCASDIESLPRTVLEAMAAGLPVLATDAFGLPEVVIDRKTGWLCASRDTGDLARALSEAMRAGPFKRWRVRRAARKLIEREHRLEDCSARYAEVMREAACES